MNRPNSSVGSATVTKVRRLYQETWSCEWPHGDSYLRDLWIETRNEVRNGNHKVPPTIVWERCVEAMRENHPFA